MGCGRVDRCRERGGGACDGDVGEYGRGVGVDRGDDDGGHGSVLAPPGERGREPPFFFVFLDLLPRREKGLPCGGVRAPPRLDLSLYLSLFLRSQIWPFTVSYIPGDP